MIIQCQQKHPVDYVHPEPAQDVQPALITVPISFYFSTPCTSPQLASLI